MMKLTLVNSLTSVNSVTCLEYSKLMTMGDFREENDRYEWLPDGNIVMLDIVLMT